MVVASKCAMDLLQIAHVSRNFEYHFLRNDVCILRTQMMRIYLSSAWHDTHPGACQESRNDDEKKQCDR
jgi:hypothetical protein